MPTAGQQVRRHREARGLTVGELARFAAMDAGNVSRLERGRHEPTLSTLSRVAAALGVRVSDLLPPDASDDQSVSTPD